MGAASGVFFSTFAILLLFNAFYVMGGNTGMEMLVTGMLTTLLIAVIPVVVVGGLQIFGSGLNTRSVGIIFGISMLMGILWAIEIPSGVPVAGTNILGMQRRVTGSSYSIQIGLGLANNVLAMFPIGELGGVGFLFASLLSVFCFMSGVVLLVGGGGD